MSNEYEVHIVAYGDTDFSNVPLPFFINAVQDSTAGLAGIATVETDNELEALDAFQLGLAWAKACEEEGKPTHLHVKCEVVLGHLSIESPVDSLTKQYKSASEGQTVRRDAYIAGYDVHLDGAFTPELKEQLKDQGWIVLDYISSDNKTETTLTKHFTDEPGCKAEYQSICSYIQDSGGFAGRIYYERPLGFQVFGNTNERPIICSL